jgi:hypothetical protein
MNTSNRCTARQLTSKINKMQKAAEEGDSPQWQKFHGECSTTRVDLVMSTGTLIDPRIAGFAWAWKLMSAYQHLPCGTETDKLAKGIAENGLAGFVTVSCDLMTALLVAQEVGVYKICVYMRKSSAKTRAQMQAIVA